MQKKMCFIVGFFILAFPLLAQSFDCNKPDFGARIEELNKDGYFVKYMEKGGISYYSMIKFLSNMLILLSLLKSKNILYILLNQVLMFFRRKKLDNRVLQLYRPVSYGSA